METQKEFIAVGDLLGNSWKIYKAKFKTLVGILLLPTLVLFILLVAGFFTLESFVWAGETINSGDTFPGDIGTIDALDISALTVFIIFSIVMLVFYLFAQIAGILAVGDPDTKKVWDYYVQAKKYFWPFIWVSFLFGIVVLGGSILFIIPGIIFFIWFSQATFVVLFENIHGWSALKRSKRYVKGRWWGVVGRIVFIGLIMGVISMAVQFAVFIISLILMLLIGLSSGSETLIGIVSLAMSLLGQVAGVIVAPLAVVYSYLMYVSLRETYNPVVSAASAATQEPKDEISS